MFHYRKSLTHSRLLYSSLFYEMQMIGVDMGVSERDESKSSMRRKEQWRRLLPWPPEMRIVVQRSGGEGVGQEAAEEEALVIDSVVREMGYGGMRY